MRRLISVDHGRILLPLSGLLHTIAQRAMPIRLFLYGSTRFLSNNLTRFPNETEGGLTQSTLGQCREAHAVDVGREAIGKPAR
jgi:hypothetical protein